MRSFILTMAVVTVAAPVRAGCVLLPQHADAYYQLIAVSRHCPEFNGLDDKRALQLGVTTGILDRKEVEQPWCQREVLGGVASFKARLERVPVDKRGQFCKSMLSAMSEADRTSMKRDGLLK